MPKLKTEEVQVDDRKLNFRRSDNYGNYEIYREGGGVIPKELKGIFTAPNLAIAALSRYQEMQGNIDEQRKIKAEIQSIVKLDHTYDGV
jgi:hypothetical protein